MPQEISCGKGGTNSERNRLSARNDCTRAELEPQNGPCRGRGNPCVGRCALPGVPGTSIRRIGPQNPRRKNAWGAAENMEEDVSSRPASRQEPSVRREGKGAFGPGFEISSMKLHGGYRWVHPGPRRDEWSVRSCRSALWR